MYKRQNDTVPHLCAASKSEPKINACASLVSRRLKFYFLIFLCTLYAMLILSYFVVVVVDLCVVFSVYSFTTEIGKRFTQCEPSGLKRTNACLFA